MGGGGAFCRKARSFMIQRSRGMHTNAYQETQTQFLAGNSQEIVPINYSPNRYPPPTPPTSLLFLAIKLDRVSYISGHSPCTYIYLYSTHSFSEAFIKLDGALAHSVGFSNDLSCLRCTTQVAGENVCEIVIL